MFVLSGSDRMETVLMQQALFFQVMVSLCVIYDCKYIHLLIFQDTLIGYNLVIPVCVFCLFLDYDT